MVNEKRRASEFKIIAEVFAPLAAAMEGAYGLADDAAVLTLEPGRQMVVTTDTIVAGVHFTADATPEEVAARLLAVNLSDLAAMGAEPLAYTLSAALDDRVDDDWLGRFARRLAAEQETYGLGLVGGDTVATPGPLTLTVAAFGTVAEGRALLRSSARPGDRIYVSGTIGDGALGLRALGGGLAGLDADHRAALIDRYRRPRPRVALGQGLVGLAQGCVDISDGLAADLGHMAAASGTAAVVEAARVPLSPAGRAAVDADGDLMRVVLGGGDDYELLFTASVGAGEAIEALSRRLDLTLSAIGHMSKEGPASAAGSVTILDSKGVAIHLKEKGYQHS